MPASALSQENWFKPTTRDHHWLEGSSPFRWTLDFRDDLVAAAPRAWKNARDVAEAICFRYTFKNPIDGDRQDRELRVGVVAEGLAIDVWINGRQLPDQSDTQRKKGVYEAVFPATYLVPRKNVIAAQVRKPDNDPSAAMEYNAPVFSLRLDVVPPRYYLPDVLIPDDDAGSEVKLITERAAVCDLCSSLPSQNPACVSQCPHDAAIRIEARTEFDSLVVESV